jgi:ParB family chromosome partitioning protein
VKKEMERKIEFKIVDVDDLVPNPFQPRAGFPKETLKELADSLNSRGEIQPIIVRRHKKGYQIICGERRWRAAKLAGMDKIPVLVRDTTEEDVLLESLIENLHREDLTSVERENAVYELWKTGRWKTKEELAKALGKKTMWVYENLSAAETRRKEKLPPEVSTRMIVDTTGLREEERKQIIAKVERGEITAEKVREYAKVTREATKPVKKAVLKPKSRITPPVARKLLELPEEKQAEAIKQIESLRLEEGEAISHIESMKLEIPPPIPPEKWEEVREKYKKLQEEIKARLETPEAKERGRLFRNWTGHIAISGALESVFCPICGSRELGWLCHKLSLKEALNMTEEKYKESTGGK